VATTEEPPAPDGPQSVLDASALLAFIQDERGASVVAEALAATAAISVVNWAEVLSKVAERGRDADELATGLHDHGFVGELLTIEAMTEADCMTVAWMRPVTRSAGLSLADRTCLALARRLGLPVLTADRSWLDLELGVDVRLIR
jgi:PIN domain nuclease of toxin-antitoxin system